MRRGKKWCPYRIPGAVRCLTVFLLSLPEARAGWSCFRPGKA
jgi:hypothetical protein